MDTGYIAPTTSGSSSSSSSSGSKTTMGQDAFLSLLVTELQHQDPTSAQDPNTMITQMAQFSTLEQQTNTNTLLTNMQGQVSALYQAESTSLIGTDVQVTNSSLKLSGGTASIGIAMPSDAAKVAITVKNASGQTVATLNPGSMSAGDQVVKWDGKGTNGSHEPDGTYTVSIAAVDASGNPVAATTTSSATVTAVNFVNGAIMVTAGGQQYPLSAISQISY
ncbi:MAG: flagellar hook assembly protein FlgD [Holophaga sp.]|nr:flagellar hook assembly protein FlgD [Holophaga sp.]